ncbi:copper resistance CopC family protein [Arenibacterium sp. CAU 1754]
MRHFLLAVLFVLTATWASAHSKVSKTHPPDGAVLGEFPAQISMSFGKKVKLTRVEILQSDTAVSDLDLSGQDGFTTEVVLPVEPAGPGGYTVEWRGLGIDGHVVKGAFSFTVE